MTLNPIQPNSKDYILVSTAGKKSGLDYIPITYGSGKLENIAI